MSAELALRRQLAGPVVVIGASAGGLEVLQTLMGGLPPTFPAALLIVMHLAPEYPSFLPQLLQHAGSLPVHQAAEGDRPGPGEVYVGRPDHHLLLRDGRLLVRRGPRENRFRPSIDVLFRSAAMDAGNRVIGVTLTGMLDDGASGMGVIQQLGGVTIVQDPQEAQYSSMPRSVLGRIRPDHVVRADELASLLTRLVTAPAQELPGARAPEGASPAEESSEEKSPGGKSPAGKPPGGKIMSAEERQRLITELDLAAGDPVPAEQVLRLGAPTPFTCPTCHGVLVQIEEYGRERYRCHTGHGFSSESLLAGLHDSVERTTWSAIRALDEDQLLLERLARQLDTDRDPDLSASARRRAKNVQDLREQLRRSLEQDPWSEELGQD